MKTFYQLTEEERLELKRALYCDTHPRASYGELANVDELVSYEEIEENYRGIEFTDDDFWCNQPPR